MSLIDIFLVGKTEEEETTTVDQTPDWGMQAMKKPMDKAFKNLPQGEDFPEDEF